MNLREAALKYKSKLDQIKVCAFDIDGVLTDGTMRYEGKEMGWNRTYNVRDGYGIMMLREAGFKVAIISAGESNSVQERFKNRIKVDYLCLGNIDKREGYRKILDDGYEDEEILYMGDEFFDLPLLKRAGFSAAPPQASEEILEAVDYVTVNDGGHGCVREVIDMLRYNRDFTPRIEDF